MSAYHYERMAEMERQLLLSPPDVRQRHCDRLEALAMSLRPDGTYSYEFTYFRVTGFRSAKPTMESYEGARLRRDVTRLLETVSRGAPTAAADVPEPVLSLQQVVQRAGVSVRTLHRWRCLGLVSRKYVFPDGRRRTGVRQSALDGFLEQGRGKGGRSRPFSRLNEQERRDILRQARELAAAGKLSLTAAAARIARATDRAKETVRRVLLEHERQAPDAALFGPRRGLVRDDEMRRIHDAQRAGQSVQAICNRFRLSRASVYRLLNEARARALLEDTSVPEGLIEEEAFNTADAERQFAPERDAPPATWPMKPDEERRLLRLYNYLKSRIARLKKRVNPRRYVPAGLLDEIETLLAAVAVVRARILAEHLPLVIRVARQHAGGLARLPDLVGEGMLCVVRAMDSFDYRRERAFEAYASWALMREFARTVPEEQYESAAGTGPARQESADEPRAALEVVRQRMGELLAGASTELRNVVRSRFGVETVQPGEILARVRPHLEAAPEAGDAGPGRQERP